MTVLTYVVNMSFVNWEKVKSMRNEMGLTLRQVAEISGLGLHQWGNLEAGQVKNPTIETLSRIAKALKCSVGELLLDYRIPRRTPKVESVSGRKRSKPTKNG